MACPTPLSGPGRRTARAALADASGSKHRASVWTGDKPATGLAAAARAARHRLLADATREVGAVILLMGHTARRPARGAADARRGLHGGRARAQWSPSPVWPEGRGVFILRPMIEVRVGRRSVAASRSLGETWLDDPANTFDEARCAQGVRAPDRRRGDEGPSAGRPDPRRPRSPPRSIGWAGDDRRSRLAALTPLQPHRPPDRFLSAAVLCAAGKRIAAARRGARADCGTGLIGRLSPWRRPWPARESRATAITLRIMRDDGAMRSNLPRQTDGGRVRWPVRNRVPRPKRRQLTAMSGHMAKARSA